MSRRTTSIRSEGGCCGIRFAHRRLRGSRSCSSPTTCSRRIGRWTVSRSSITAGSWGKEHPPRSNRRSATTSAWSSSSIPVRSLTSSPRSSAVELQVLLAAGIVTGYPLLFPSSTGTRSSSWRRERPPSRYSPSGSFSSQHGSRLRRPKARSSSCERCRSRGSPSSSRISPSGRRSSCPALCSRSRSPPAGLDSICRSVRSSCLRSFPSS
jgi:hypothetical protein